MDDFKILIDKESIARRVRELALQAGLFCADNSEGVLVLWLKEGAGIFAADLVRETGLSVECLGVKVSSYGNSMRSCGSVKVSDEIKTVKARKVLLVDDILDTGATALEVCGILKGLGVSEIKTCFLLEKEGRDRGGFKADFVGFKIPDLFVFGYGLDLKGKLRDLPHICVMEKI